MLANVERSVETIPLRLSRAGTTADHHLKARAHAVSSLAWLATRAVAFSHPTEVLTNPDLTDPERKAILASWASDARAVEGMPWRRRLEAGTTVPVSEVLAAICAFDRGSDDDSKRGRPRRASKPGRIIRHGPGISICPERAP